MNTLELPAAVRAADQAMPRHTGGEILDHFRQKYPVVELDGREVFLFTSARGFGDRKHIVAFHSSEFATVPEHIYQYVLITYCYSGHFRLVVDNSAVTLGAGDCFVADRHVPHGVLPTGPDDIAINIILNDRFFQRRMMTDIARLHASFATALATPGDSHAGWRVYRTAGDELARTCIERILCEHLDPRAGTPDIIDDFIAALLTHLFRTYESDQERVREDEKYSTLIGDVRGYIEQNYADGHHSAGHGQHLQAAGERGAHASCNVAAKVQQDAGLRRGEGGRHLQPDAVLQALPRVCRLHAARVPRPVRQGAGSRVSLRTMRRENRPPVSSGETSPFVMLCLLGRRAGTARPTRERTHREHHHRYRYDRC